MSAEREELVRVERFEDLRPGDYVLCKRCRCDEGEHRGILMSPHELEEGGHSFPLSPQPACADDAGPDNPFSVARDAVELRCIYRFETGLEGSPAETKSRRHPKPARVG